MSTPIGNGYIAKSMISANNTKTAPILNPQTLNKSPLPSTKILQYSANSIEGLAYRIAADVSFSGSYDFLEGSVKAAFEEHVKSSSSYYVSIIQITYSKFGFSYPLTNEQIQSDPDQYLTPSFLEAINSQKFNIDAFLANYGTHLLLGGQFGGSVTLQYYCLDTSSFTQEDFDASVALKYNNHLGTSLNARVNVAAGLTYNTANVTMSTNISILGGDPSELGNLLSDPPDVHLDKWLQSMTEDTAVLMGWTEAELAADLPPLWSCIPAGDAQSQLLAHGNPAGLPMPLSRFEVEGNPSPNDASSTLGVGQAYKILSGGAEVTLPSGSNGQTLIACCPKIEPHWDSNNIVYLYDGQHEPAFYNGTGVSQGPYEVGAQWMALSNGVPNDKVDKYSDQNFTAQINLSAIALRDPFQPGDPAHWDVRMWVTMQPGYGTLGATVGEGYCLVGGGAYCLSGNNAIYVIASRPDPQSPTTTWSVTSNANITAPTPAPGAPPGASGFATIVMAIGLKPLNGQDLSQSMFLSEGEGPSFPAPDPSVRVHATSGTLVACGGGSTGANNMLRVVRPLEGGIGCEIASKDNEVQNPAQVHGSVISILGAYYEPL